MHILQHVNDIFYTDSASVAYWNAVWIVDTMLVVLIADRHRICKNGQKILLEVLLQIKHELLPMKNVLDLSSKWLKLVKK